MLFSRKPALFPMRIFAYLACFLPWLTPSLPASSLVLAPLFRDHAVLQRDRPIHVWGWDAPGTRVVVALDQHQAETFASPEGRWQVILPPLPASFEPRTLLVHGSSTIQVQQILLGEVWLVSGQSNMEWRVYHARDEDLVRALARHPAIREIKVTRNAADQPSAHAEGTWRPAVAEYVGNFSAVAYAFALDLHGVLDTPVGIIHAAWGGSRLEAWLPPAEIDALGVSRGHESPHLRAAALYNGMIHPLAPYPLRGILWYQGESNAGSPHLYQSRFNRLILSWRAAFQQGDLPFYWVQLASFGGQDPDGTSWAFLREAQTRTLALPATGQALAYDLGDAHDIHPLDKAPLGRRLARLALRQTYGLNHPDRGPQPREILREGTGFRISFDHAYGGLRTPDRALLGFELASTNRVFHPALARLEGDSVFVWCDTLPDPVALRYAWRNFTPANLYHQRLLPALPFRTDDWPSP